jgi:hypothetical protein
VPLLQLQLGGVLDGDDAFPVRDERGERVQHGRLAGAGAARDEAVELGLHAGGQERQHLRRGAVDRHHVLDPQRRAAEAANGEHRPVDGQRGDDGVDAGAVGQAGVGHGRRFVDPAAHPRHDAHDDLLEVRVVPEAHVGQLQLAEPLDVDRIEAVDHDVGDGRVGQQWLERPEARHLVEQLLHHLLALDAVERQVAGGEQLVEDGAQLVPKLIAREALDRLQI